uniref:Uncharacterized protein n=1 Tax=viral metagenome TaxID=1070528 RepID=A0A6M3JVT7_9ZZZZ
MKHRDELFSYLTTALWSSGDREYEHLDGTFMVSDIADETMKQARKDIESFMERAAEFLHPNDPTSHIGHDFWLTRNGHGAGFWDGDYVNGDKLTELSEQFGELTPYIGDDEKIYFS